MAFRGVRYAVTIVDIGRLIIVWGPTGSGKTTVAARIAACLAARHIEMDAVFGLPDWVNKPPEDFRTDISSILDD